MLAEHLTTPPAARDFIANLPTVKLISGQALCNDNNLWFSISIPEIQIEALCAFPTKRCIAVWHMSK